MCALQRLVKCRLRSEIEARKAVESTMKRAVQEARELKKELVLLRQEKEELRSELQARKHAVSAPGDAKKAAPDDVTAAAVKAAEKKLQQQIQKLTAENAALREQLEQFAADSTALVDEKTAMLAQTELELKKSLKDVAALEDEAKKLRIVSDETRRKYQKLVKEKKEDLAKSLQENEHLARCKETLERQLELLPQLKKQLQYAKDKSSGVAEDWQKKLETREQAFVRHEAESKQQITALQHEVVALEDDKEQLRAQLDELTSRVYENEQRHDATQRKQAEQYDHAVATTKSLQEQLRRATTELEDARDAQRIADETLAQESKLRQMADDAADAVEARALKCETQLADALEQLAQLESALQTRGITRDFLLKAPQSSTSNNNNSRSAPASTEKRRDTKAIERPETSASASAKRDVKARSSSSASVSTRRPVSSASASREPSAPVKTAKAAPLSSTTALKTRAAQASHVAPGASKPRAVASGAKRVPLSHRSASGSTNNNNSELERDGTPERTRRS